MATVLSKNVTRESTETHDERNINVTLGEDQTVKLKLKGMRTGEVSIPIKQLYCQLADCEEVTEDKPKKAVSYSRKEKGRYVQPDPKTAKTILNDLRSQNAISTMDAADIAKFDQLIVNLLNNYKA